MKTSEDDFIIRSSCRYRTLLKIRFGVSVLRKINLMKSYFYLAFHYQLFNGLNKKSGAKSLDPVYLLITLNSGLVCEISTAKKKKKKEHVQESTTNSFCCLPILLVFLK